jgi:hypothetical protein
MRRIRGATGGAPCGGYGGIRGASARGREDLWLVAAMEEYLAKIFFAHAPHSTPGDRLPEAVYEVEL